jgi:hypothetical protein
MTSLDAGTQPCAADEFLDVICADPELLQAEFDAIIDAEWPAGSPPAATPLVVTPPPAATPPAAGRGDTGQPTGRAGLGPARRRRGATGPRVPRPATVRRWRRQRSPPQPTTSQAPTRKGR